MVAVLCSLLVGFGITLVVAASSLNAGFRKTLEMISVFGDHHLNRYMQRVDNIKKAIESG